VPRWRTVVSALIYLVVAIVAAGVIFLLASLVFGRGEELEPLPPGATPTRLPSADIRGQDVRSLRFQQVFRGYKAVEVDWALERLAGEIDQLRGRVALLENRLGEPGGRNPSAEGG
jgi:DivIVA domain-containing protein